MTDVASVFPDVKPTEANEADSETLARNIQQESFDAAVRAEVARQLAAQGAGDSSGYRTADGPVRIARDNVTGDHYGGLVSAELVDLCEKTDGGVVLAVQRSIVKNKFGEKENVWFPAPEWDGVTPIPGEYRKVYMETQPEGDAS